ncbi:hypothetical protein DER45DRAFT_552475 [Fusarium avenaceum]|nr:hypothetical protein DER45DRAFT_552475 [Fusarium avenaceum]
MAPPFTFVNVSNAPGLGPKEAKQMRGHITKVNFAKRRQRLSKEKDSKKPVRSAQGLDLSKVDAQGLWLEQQMMGSAFTFDPACDRLLSHEIDPMSSPVDYLVCEFRPMIFPAGTGAPGSSREASWISLLQSEPALVEASVSIALRYSPRRQNPKGFREASICKGRAIKLINERLDTPLGLTDGVLSAVFTLTFAELLESDGEARKVHIGGLAQMIKVRRSSGNNALPSWFCDFLLYDSIGNSILSASYANQPLIQALRNEDDPNKTDFTTLRDEIGILRQLIDRYHASPTPKKQEAAIIHSEVTRLQLEIDTLMGSQENFVRSLHDSLQLFLLLLWPTEKARHLEVLAEELKYALLQPHMRLCSSMHLLVWQLFVGATAARPSSEVRSWYITRLREVLTSLSAGGQATAMETLTESFSPDKYLLEKFKAVWRELACC